MGELIIRHCGFLAVPQLAISTITVTLLVGYLVALRRGEVLRGLNPWDKTLEPLAGISTTLGLLGSVVGFIIAFGNFQSGLDIASLSRGLSAAYWTTGLGIVTSLVATCGAYALTVLNRPRSQS